MSLNILKKHQIFQNDFSASGKLQNFLKNCTKPSDSRIVSFLTNGWFVSILKDGNYTISQVKKGCEFVLYIFTVTHILHGFFLIPTRRNWVGVGVKERKRK